MLLHCDMVFLSEDAVLTTPFVNLALIPEAASSLTLPARIGHARAFAMFVLGEAVDANKAVEWGIANAVCPLGRVTRASARGRGCGGGEARFRGPADEDADARRRCAGGPDGDRGRPFRHAAEVARGARSVRRFRAEAAGLGDSLLERRKLRIGHRCLDDRRIAAALGGAIGDRALAIRRMPTPAPSARSGDDAGLSAPRPKPFFFGSSFLSFAFSALLSSLRLGRSGQAGGAVLDGGDRGHRRSART